MIPDNKLNNNDVFSVGLWVLIVISLFFGIWSLSLHSSDQEKFVTAPTFLVANIAILSTIIVVSAFVVTAAGLAKLESIKEKAMETAEETAEKVAEKIAEKVAEKAARESTEEIVRNVEDILKNFEEVKKAVYTSKGELFSEHFRPSGSPDKGHEDENKGS